jgi:hypothetical protein
VGVKGPAFPGSFVPCPFSMSRPFQHKGGGLIMSSMYSFPVAAHVAAPTCTILGAAVRGGREWRLHGPPHQVGMGSDAPYDEEGGFELFFDALGPCWNASPNIKSLFPWRPAP